MAKKEYNCPDCDAAIPLEDINIASDIALCRDCGNSHTFSELAECDGGEIDRDLLQSPPKKIRIFEDFDGTAVIESSFNKWILLFLLPFTCVWSGGSMYGIYIQPLMNNKELELDNALFGLPFLFGTFVLVSINLVIMFGRTRLRLKQGRGEYSFGWGLLTKRKPFNFDEDTKVKLQWSNCRQNNQRLQEILIVNEDKKCNFGAFGFQEKHKAFIAAVLRRAILEKV